MSLSTCNLSVLGAGMYVHTLYQYSTYQICSYKLPNVIVGHIPISIDVPQLEARNPGSSGWVKADIVT
jgi:hypothetical protein